MTALIWMLTWLPQVLPDLSKLPQPVNLSLTSIHFNHMLKWEHGPGTPAGVHYRVTMNTERGSSWEPVAGCEHVQDPLVCNLTQALANTYQVYFIEVTALLDAQASEPATYSRFEPMKDTHLDLPLLTVTSCNDTNLCVDLQPPLAHLRLVYELLHYKLKIEYGSARRVQDTHSLRRKVLANVPPGTECCVSVCFSDTVVPRKSDYSRPVCVSTPGKLSADSLISAALCLLVMCGVILLLPVGYVFLIRRPLPKVLTSIQHIEGALYVSPCRTSLSSLLNLKPTPPSSGEKRSSRTPSDDSDGDSVTDTTGGSRGAGYNLRQGTNLLYSSSCTSSSSLLAPEPEPTPAADLLNPQPAAQTSPDSGLMLDSLPGSDEAVSDPPADSDRSTAVRIQVDKDEEEEEEVEEVVDILDVNLLTLTFGRFEQDEEEEEEKLHVESSSASGVLPVQKLDTDVVALETVSCSVNEDEEEEEEEEESGYMGRPSAHVLHKLLF